MKNLVRIIDVNPL